MKTKEKENKDMNEKYEKEIMERDEKMKKLAQSLKIIAERMKESQDSSEEKTIKFKAQVK